MATPETERPAKSSFQLTAEGCLLFVLFGIITGVAVTIVIMIFNSIFRR